MPDNVKKLAVLQGKVLSLHEGERALIRFNGTIICTSTVIAINADTIVNTRFETRNLRYCIVPVPDDASPMGTLPLSFYTPAESAPASPACA